MPSVVLDTDSKYDHLIELYLKLHSEKHEYRDKNNNFENPNCKIFDNVLEALNWLTMSKDPSLREQLENVTDDGSKEAKKTNVLITGSLYLVGLSLKVLNYKID